MHGSNNWPNMDNTNQFILSTNIEESDWSPLFVFLYKASKDLRSISVMYPAGLDGLLTAKNTPIDLRTDGVRV